LEKLEGVPPVFSVAATVEGMAAFQEACGPFNYALCSRDVGAIVVCTTDDYVVYLGTEEFVEGCLGERASEALQTYRAYVESFEGMPGMQEMLEAVEVALVDAYPKAPEGAMVSV
jgi:hypothetical protein